MRSDNRVFRKIFLQKLKNRMFRWARRCLCHEKYTIILFLPSKNPIFTFKNDARFKSFLNLPKFPSYLLGDKINPALETSGIFFSNLRFPPSPPRQLLIIIALEFNVLEFCPFWGQNHDIGRFLSYKRYQKESSIIASLADFQLPTRRYGFKKGRLRTWTGGRN